MLQPIDFGIFFLLSLVASFFAFYLVLDIFFKRGLKEIRIMFQNDLPHALVPVAESMMSKKVKTERAYKGVDAKKEKKELKMDNWSQFVNIVGPDIASYVQMIPDSFPIKAQIIEGAIADPQAAKTMIVQFLGGPGSIFSGPQAHSQGGIEFQE